MIVSSSSAKWSFGVDFEVYRRSQGERRHIVPLHCADIFVVPCSSRPEVFLASLMVGIDDREGPRWLLVPSSPI